MTAYEEWDQYHVVTIRFGAYSFKWLISYDERLGWRIGEFVDVDARHFDADEFFRRAA